ncbi:MAG: trypsin-like serine protease [Nocardioidaceae bacterium]|nr:trypsin-like serine protease [Nocardioidaceae bacterium]
MRKRFLALAAAVTVTLGLAGPALASTGGTPDGDDHPNVGLILAYSEDGNRYRCTATLVREDLLLTAAHCTDGVVGKMLVTFDSEIWNSPTPPPVSPFPTADPAVGYTTAQLQDAGFESGDAHTHPNYSDFTDVRNWNDVGVVTLDEPVTDIEPAAIAGLNTLDGIKASNLSKTLFRAVGYGTEVRKPDAGPQKPAPMSYPLIRRWVDMPGQKLTPQILQTNGNDKDPRGTGGTCFGDSGGPVFYQGKIVAVTSYGLTQNCRYLGGYQRVDIAAAQDWLMSDFGFTF